MDEKKFEQTIFPVTENTCEHKAIIRTTWRERHRRFENYLVIWVDEGIDQNNEACKNALAQLQSIIEDVYMYTKYDDCIDFLNKVDDMKVFLVLSDTIGQQMVPLIHDIACLDCIAIFCSTKAPDTEWSKKWKKIKGTYTEFAPICTALRLTRKQSSQDDISISFVSLDHGAFNQNLNQLEPSFMYTQLFKEILLDMKHDQQAVKYFIEFWRTAYTENPQKLRDITEFERDYTPQLSIWWYTREYFVYYILNSALRTLEAEAILKMGFFISDIHRQIETLHKQQIRLGYRNPFRVFRGQDLSTTDFERLMKNKGGLIAFNNFLSTSIYRDVSFQFAESVISKADTVGILFQISIDPAVPSTPFASVEDLSYYQEDEILFSMHSIFRIDEIRQIYVNRPIYEVDLTLTPDDDEQLRELTDCIRREVSGSTGWKRLGQLLLKISRFCKAEELYIALLEQSHDDNDRAHYYHLLGFLKNSQGEFTEAVSFYEKSIEIARKILPEDHISLANTYSNIGNVYNNMGDYPKALKFYEKGADIHKKNLPSNHPDLASSYGNLGWLYNNMGDYLKALEYYEKDLEIAKSLSNTHPALATAYNNVGEAYNNMRDNSRALEYNEKARELWERSLPANHPSLAVCYGNISGVHATMRDFSKALEYSEKAVKIQETLSQNHPGLPDCYSNIAYLYQRMGDPSTALQYEEKALKIREKILPENHPDFVFSYGNIGMVYNKLRDYSTAVTFLEKALAISQMSLPSTHPTTKTLLDNLDYVKNKM